MKRLNVLNLYACLGGNRLLWDNCDVTAVELDPILAELYQDRFPNDTVIVGDAHQYLLDNYKNFDFIWSSPPCPSHSRARYWKSKGGEYAPVYPDMTLYQEIIFLDNFFKGKYVVENVIPYYKPLIPAEKRGRHMYWTNFNLPKNINERKSPVGDSRGELKKLCEYHDYDFYKYKGDQTKIKIARNLVDYQAGKAIFDLARGAELKRNDIQVQLF